MSRAQESCPRFLSLLVTLLEHEFYSKYLVGKKTFERIRLVIDSCDASTNEEEKKKILLVGGVVNLDQYPESRTALQYLKDHQKKLINELTEAYFPDHRRKVLITDLLEYIVNFSSKAIISSKPMETGILLYLSNVPMFIFKYFTESKLSCSWETAKDMVEELKKRNQKKILQHLEKIATDTSKPLIIYMDNFNLIKCRTRFTNGRKFTASIPSISILFRTMEDSPGDYLQKESPANPLFPSAMDPRDLTQGTTIPEELEELEDLKIEEAVEFV